MCVWGGGGSLPNWTILGVGVIFKVNCFISFHYDLLV